MPLQNPDRLALILSVIRDGLCACLEEETPDGRPTNCFISHGEPADDCCDFLAVWLRRIYPTTKFPQFTEGSDRCGNTHAAVEFGVRLMRPCFPTLEDNAFNPFPDQETSIEPAAENLLIDAWVLECCLLGLGSTFGPANDCQDFRMGELRPAGPRGGCAGWTLWGTLEEFCC
jgi:hypothetical protein